MPPGLPCWGSRGELVWLEEGEASIGGSAREGVEGALIDSSSSLTMASEGMQINLAAQELEALYWTGAGGTGGTGGTGAGGTGRVRC